MERQFHIIEDALSPDDCAYFLKATLDKANHDDPKPHFRGVGYYDQNLLDKGLYPEHLDPEHRLPRIIEMIRDYYLSTHEMLGEFVFSRVFGNIMDTGASLPSHLDEDPDNNGNFDGKKRSHVCSILLNDDYEGGELLFDDQGVVTKPKPGALVLFPGFYVHHGVNEVTKGSRVNLLVFFYDVIP